MHSSKKLKVLCLHGYNSTKEVFDYQLRGFKEAYGDLMDFHILDGPFIVERDPPPQYYVASGVWRGPYWTWFGIEGWSEKEPLSKCTSKLTGVKESVEYILSYMKEHGPFDGFITFSGGQTILRYMYRILFEIDPYAYNIDL